MAISSNESLRIWPSPSYTSTHIFKQNSAYKLLELFKLKQSKIRSKTKNPCTKSASTISNWKNRYRSSRMHHQETSHQIWSNRSSHPLKLGWLRFQCFRQLILSIFWPNNEGNVQGWARVISHFEFSKQLKFIAILNVFYFENIMPDDYIILNKCGRNANLFFW